MSGFSALIVEFPNGSRDFVLGFEAGRLWAAFQAGEIPYGQPFHAENAEVVIRMAEASGVSVAAEFTEDDNWMTLEARGEDG